MIGCPGVAALVGGVDIRYHFAGSEDEFYAMPPFQNTSGATRFYGIPAEILISEK